MTQIYNKETETNTRRDTNIDIITLRHNDNSHPAKQKNIQNDCNSNYFVYLCLVIISV